MYNETVIDHFNNPRNIGELAEVSAIGEASSSSCGDTTFIYLQIENGIIIDARFKTFGCAAAIAAASILTTLIIGNSLEMAKAISNDDVIAALGGLPEKKISCAALATDALHKAIEEYENEQQK